MAPAPPGAGGTLEPTRGAAARGRRPGDSGRRVCVYCASSGRCDPEHLRAAGWLGRGLAQRGHTVVYGAGSVGLMGALADAALAAGGRVIGVIPSFMREREWHHPGVDETHVVATMHARKELMLELGEVFVALPGGTGTLEELVECLSHRSLGLHDDEVIIADWGGFYAPLIAQLQAMEAGRFLGTPTRELFSVAGSVEEVLALVEQSRAQPESEEGT